MTSGGNFSAAPRGNAGNFNGGNGSISFRGNSRTGRMDMGRMDHDRGHDHDHDGQFRGPGFAFGFYPGYDYDAYDYDNSCYRMRQVHTRYGWRWLRVWVCD